MVGSEPVYCGEQGKSGDDNMEASQFPRGDAPLAVRDYSRRVFCAGALTGVLVLVAVLDGCAARLDIAATTHDILFRYRYLYVERQLARRHGLERTSKNGKFDDACRHTARVRRRSDFATERGERLGIERHGIDRDRSAIRLDKGFDILLKVGNPRSPGSS